jgi:hypothetical protein
MQREKETVQTLSVRGWDVPDYNAEGCDHVMYCSEECCKRHWETEHNTECRSARCMRCNAVLSKVICKCGFCDLIYACSDECFASLMVNHSLVCIRDHVKAISFRK